MAAISVLVKPASGLCNMACEYCFYCDEGKKRQEESYGLMSEETLRNVIRKTMLNADRQITYAFQGGEPSVRGLDFFRKALEYQKKYNHHGIRVDNAFQTNGFAIDEAWCRFFVENHFLVGLSVDGTREIHDRYRRDKQGDPTYDRILKAAELMDRFGVEYNILTVVTADVAGHVEEIYEEYRRRGWKYQQYIACLDPLEEDRGAHEYSLLPLPYGRFLARLFDLWYEDWKRGLAPYIRQFENYIGILLGYAPEACDMRGRCTVQCVVEADGSTYPCDFYVLDEWKTGNFNTDRFEQIRTSPVGQAFAERSFHLAEKCSTCPYLNLCRGGCRRHRDDHNNYFCDGYRYFFDHCAGKMQEIAEKIRMQNK